MLTPSTPEMTRIYRRRFMLSLALIVLLLLGGGSGMAYLVSLRQPASLREPTIRQYNVEVFRVQPADLQEIVTAFGTAVADKQVLLAAQVAGEVIEVHPQLKVGTQVNSASAVSSATGPSIHDPGDRLVVIEPRTYQERVIQVEGRIAEARTEMNRLDQEEKNLDRLRQQLEQDLADVRQEFEKMQQLVARKISTDSDLRRAQLEMRVVETKLVQNLNDVELIPARREQIVRRIATLQNDLEVARHDLERTTVRPPFRGRLSAVSVELGQYVRPGDALVQLTDASHVEVPLSVSLEDYAKLVPFVRAQRFPKVELAENEGAAARWTGELIRVSPQADERTRTVQVFVQVDNLTQETPLLPGTFVHARIAGPILSQALVVPRDAVMNGRGFLLREQVAKNVTVQISRTIGAFAIVTSGFRPGDEVILSNLDVLYDGAPVTASITHDLANELQRRATPALRVLR